MTSTKAAEPRSNRGVRAVVVDDSQFMRTLISDMLDAGGITVVETASNGERGVEAVKAHAPNVVTMDLKMPDVDGIEAVERIMAECPTPVLILSAYAADDAELTFEALENGAVDFFEKPSGEVSVGLQKQREVLVSTVRSVASVDVSAPERTVESGVSVDVSAPERTVESGVSVSTDPHDPARYLERPTLVIGASTGGPTVVEEVLAGLPIEADLRILIVQHMPEGFTGRFAKRLDEASEYAVREASDGDRIGGGEALLARGGKHLRVSGYGGGRIRISLTEGEPVHSVRPAVDVTLRTAAERVDGPLSVAILTGMGADGAEGARAVSAAGGAVIAQDEGTSAVFGMPKRTIETGAVDDVRPREELVTGIVNTITTREAR
ncbi:MAG: chemotaxis-specific protein-glutamate methyltransferase CheB [Natronomonas sp.]|uniref:chemotaxis-specific protein-glutamate methyltransferase CheB n=1 Tax=Natronomonas sp. TaxID=2184060 RepID=UPI00287059DE|nr:chemotaxis-specific protein-glutamate methyltransferase CheB [Natronomonas sp.]MDR9429269.1 chemotaxis-specific protein-glutamate methyltransferase CheB [Natronomonas sp.]